MYKRQALGNLLKNCAEHTPPGGDIRVRCSENPPVSYTHLQVEEVSGCPPVAFDGASCEDVSFSYGEVLAVDDACLTLEPGTVTALLGPSGSGKSTLATLIARFADPDAGAVRIGGVDLRDMDESALYSTVSFVLQDAQLLATRCV